MLRVSRSMGTEWGKRVSCGCAVFAGLLWVGSAQARVVTDLTRTIGSDAIDPSGDGSDGVDADASNATSQATLEALPGFGGVHQWGGNGVTGSGFQGYEATTTNILSYADPTLPDVRFTATPVTGALNVGNASNPGTGGSVTTVGSAGTSFNEWLRLAFVAASSTNEMLYTIEFGNWDGASFTPGVASVQAAGFTLGNMTSATGAAAVFKDAAGNVLSTQDLPDTGGGHVGFNPPNSDSGGSSGAEFYYGYDAGASAIASIELDFKANDTSYHPFDDLGFTPVVPEPMAMGLMLLGVGALARGRRHR